MGQRLISQNLLAELEEQIGSEAFGQALDLLVADLQSALEILAQCIDSGNEARARRTGHKIKGILDQYGIRDSDKAAGNLASRYDLYWVSDCTALLTLCQSAIEEIGELRVARGAGQGEAIGQSRTTAL